MGLGILDKIFGILKPIEDLTYKYYDNDYMIYLVVGVIILFLVVLGFFIFRIIVGLFT